MLHPTSLPSAYGIGDLGPEAGKFLHFLKDSSQSWWQMLPLGPPGAGHSPYYTFSCFARNPLLISPQWLLENGYLGNSDFSDSKIEPQDHRVDFDQVWKLKRPLFQKAFSRFQTRPEKPGSYHEFLQKNQSWLLDYGLFWAVKKAHKGAAWTHWEKGIRTRQANELKVAQRDLKEDMEYQIFLQFLIDQQWDELRKKAQELEIGLMGDIPFYMPPDSSEVWTHQSMFYLQEDGTPQWVAGVPPDYFSKTGQLWGNVIYRWDKLREQNYLWWVERLRTILSRFDAVRLDHFIGFVRSWQIPFGSKTAQTGSYQEGPGALFFETIRKELGSLPIIAENLGIMTPDVEELRNRYGLPGMRVLHFSFNQDEKNPHKPQNYDVNSVVYTGTHDNDTTRGWFDLLGAHENGTNPQKLVLDTLHSVGREIHWDLIGEAFKSKAFLSIIPMQDVLGLGGEHRMNKPGTVCGNWEWRFQFQDLKPEYVEKLNNLAYTSNRSNAFDNKN